MIRSIIVLLGFIFLVSNASPQWSTEQQWNWLNAQGWIVGCNFVPSTAVNQLEMWQAETYDPKTIDRELGFAEQVGFNTLRVFLHYLAWGEDTVGFKERMNDFLTIVETHGMKVMFVLFDDCWNNDPHIGPQPAPIPGIHNSRWVQCPGNAPEAPYPGWKAYVQDILGSFGQDKRVLIWDLYNEPGNSNHKNKTLPLLTNVFQWAREVDIIQPITSPIWSTKNWAKDLNNFQIENSDIISFHDYYFPPAFKERVQKLQKHGRPLFCSEYMARKMDNTFNNILPYLKEQNIPAINWGLVEGKIQTYYSWWSLYGAPMPKIWFHDVFWQDGKPFSNKEFNLLRQINGKSNISTYLDEEF